ncbi:MAG: N-acetyl-gamma-glutamyl-phosphate reductase [Chloroflexi bacterium]|nr:N-acetyl-gamma-glutamyl-phosphate reductase [Chloroflexota bacterium]
MKGGVKVGIINVTGYAGVELARLLRHHPEAELVAVTGRSAVGQKLGEVFPHLADMDLTVEAELTDSVDLAFSALPQVASAPVVAPLVRDGLRVVDISADFRLKDASEYEVWYKAAHPAPDLLEEAVYGLTELNRRELPSARLVANPGCFPTGALLALAPLAHHDLIQGDVIFDCKSGVSGAGRGLSLFTHYSEVNENVQAYGLEGHRHLPEIIQELRKVNPRLGARVTFVPHLVPMTRGILSTCYVWPKDGALGPADKAQARVRELYQEFFRGEPFVKVVPAPPQTKHTWGNNDCLLYPVFERRTGRLVVISCLDNLVKGAAGQAIQNMNLMFGLPETAGLDHLAVYP